MLLRKPSSTSMIFDRRVRTKSTKGRLYDSAHTRDKGLCHSLDRVNAVAAGLPNPWRTDVREVVHRDLGGIGHNLPKALQEKNLINHV